MLIAAGVFGMGVIPAQAVMVRFMEPAYTVQLNGTLDLDVLIDYDQGEPAELFSYGVRMDVLDPTAANLVSLALPMQLNYDGVNGSPAMMNTSAGVLGVKGTVDMLNPPTALYTGSLLATYEMSFVKTGQVSLQLRPFNTLGPTEEIFVAGQGMVLDDFIVFGSTIVTVIPEPSVMLSGLCGLAMMVVRRRRG